MLLVLFRSGPAPNPIDRYGIAESTRSQCQVCWVRYFIIHFRCLSRIHMIVFDSYFFLLLRKYLIAFSFIEPF